MTRIGTITGTATFDAVDVESHDDSTYWVAGRYQDSTTTYEVPHDALYIAGSQAFLNGGTLSLHADDGECIWVEATEDELRITKEKRDNE